MGMLETPGRIEPCLLETVAPDIADRIAELTARATALGARLHPLTAASIAEIVRTMNCYYSNLIEGHNTMPRDIERALDRDLDGDLRRRQLQREAAAHIYVQSLVDGRATRDELDEPASIIFVRWLHERFYMPSPDISSTMPVLVGHDGAGRKAIALPPGEFRFSPEHDVTVGLHHPPSGHVVRAFMEHFERRYAFAKLGPAQRILAIPAAHHRLNYIHPFIDGNGRVSRLMSHAMALKAGIGAHGLWAVSRGLARGLKSRSEYKAMMNHADMPRQNDYDGRGNLSEKALGDFTRWFLDTMIDQTSFMAGLFELESMEDRLRRYVKSAPHLPAEAADLLVYVMLKGEMARGEASRATGLKERSARSVLSAVEADGLLVSATPKGPVRLHFTVDATDILFPRLFPES